MLIWRSFRVRNFLVGVLLAEGPAELSGMLEIGNHEELHCPLHFKGCVSRPCPVRLRPGLHNGVFSRWRTKVDRIVKAGLRIIRTRFNQIVDIDVRF